VLLLEKEEYMKILGIAIQAEIDANDYYQAIAKRVKDPSIKHLFTILAAAELKHIRILGHYSRTDERPLEFAESIDYKISETVEKPEISADMTFVEAVALAMKNEQEAMDRYNTIAVFIQDAEQKQMFEALADMEKGHKAKLEEIYTNAAYAEVW